MCCNSAKLFQHLVAAIAGPGDSDYPEGWIWERHLVPTTQIIPWARDSERVRQAVAALVADLENRRRHGDRDTNTEEEDSESPEEQTPREKALALDQVDWQPIVHPSQLAIGMEIRLRADPVSGYHYEVPQCLGQTGTILRMQGYPPTEVRFADGSLYWCDYQDLEVKAPRDW